MAQLFATGLDQGDRIERELVRDQPLRIGRKPNDGYAVGWDKCVSREHADVEWNGAVLKIHCLEKAQNPIELGEERVRSAVISSGQSFCIGQTTFTFIDDAAPTGNKLQALGDVNEQAFNRDELKEFQFRDAGQQIELLSQLPSILDESPTDADFAARIVTLLMEGIPQSDAVAVVQYELDETLSDEEESRDPENTEIHTDVSLLPAKPTMMRVATRDQYTGRFSPSRRLVLSALVQQASIVHLWNEDLEGDDEDVAEFTISDDLDWAFCTPIVSASTRGWCLYVSGITEGDMEKSDLGGDLRFAELMAQFIASVRHMRTLQEHQTQLNSFFSPKVIESLTSADAHLALVPQERDISVLFCDVRGFSRKSEQFKDDLHMLLTCVKEALAVMANGILDADGTIADFQGDAALGFWGWPVALKEGPVPACRAALEIQKVFGGNDDRGGLLAGFSVGLGISHGNAIAGQIGTPKQAKVGVFGPVVNQGARLESMTRQYGVNICIDERTAEFCRTYLKPEEGRLRKLAHVRPKGM
ncbi:MAG: adenylate/guanylate cyclase domain-containing protein, partial [Planctomycetaceae bacterium]